MKTYHHIIALSLVSVSLGLTACSGPMDEITSLILDRNFSPIGLEAKNVTTSTANLSWQPASGASSYEVEVYPDDSLAFATTPQTFTTEGVSLYLEGLTYDTKYSARVRAVDNSDASRDSKWTSVYFRSDAQQILNKMALEDVGDKDVVISWPADSIVNSASILDAQGNVVLTSAITEEEQKAGRKTIGGLTPETNYIVKIYNNGKERGSKKFTTIVDLSGATIVRSTDDFSSMLENATEGQVFALYNGTYMISSGSETPDKAGSAVIDHSVTIKGIYPTAKPTIQGTFKMQDGASLTLSNVVLDGTNNAATDQFFDYKTAGNYKLLDVEDCELIGANDQKGMFYGNTDQAIIDDVIFRNNKIHDIGCDGGDFVDVRKCYVKNITFVNNTVYNCANERDFFRYDDKASNYDNPVPVITVKNNTFYNVMNATSGKRFLYIRFNGKKGGQQITWASNLIVNTQAVYTNQSTTSAPAYNNNYYFGCTNASLFAASDPENKLYWNGDTSGKNGADPKFKDAAKGDFTIGNEEVSKLGVGVQK
uniref:DUF4957 domain-containing protein n=1 Tax=Prevotella sp. TaxID=59823 RepID=UPI00402A5845